MGMPPEPLCDQHSCTEVGVYLLTCDRVYLRACGDHRAMAVKVLKALHPGIRVNQQTDIFNEAEDLLIRRGFRHANAVPGVPAVGRFLTPS